MNNDRLLTTKEAAARLGMCQRTIQRMCSLHKLEHVRPGGRYMIYESTVEKLLEVQPATNKRKPYQRNIQRAAQELDELGRRVTDAFLANTAPDPSEPILSPQEAIQARWLDRIKAASNADEAALLRRAMERELAATRQLATEQPEAPVDATYENPPGF